jgi:hypothetical protein
MGLAKGRSCLSRHNMPREFLGVLLFGFLFVSQAHAQEVIVARETKPEAPKQVAPQSPEQPPSESATPESTKPKSHSKKSAPTLEQMRTAGALAAERLDNPSPSQKTRSGQSDAAPTPSPVVLETPRPAKKETRPEQVSTSRRPSSRAAKPEPIGAVRPTLMESGREQPSVSPSPKGQTPAP